MSKDKWYKPLTKLFERKAPAIPEERGIGGAVARLDNQSNTFGNYFSPILSRAGIKRSFADFSQEVLNRLSDDQVRDLIKRASPIVAKALADYADAVSSSWTWTSDKTEGQHPDIPQQQLLEDFLNRLEVNGVGIEEIVSTAAREMFTHGGAFMELVIDEDGSTPVDLKVLSSATARFRKAYDEVRGEYYELGQDVGFIGSNPRLQAIGGTPTLAGTFVSFDDDPTIQYKPIGRDANNPYGTPLLDPSVFHASLMAGFFDKFEQAINGYIWPNILLTIDPEVFARISGVASSPELETKFRAAVQEIQESVKKLKPGDAIIQSSAVSIDGSFKSQNRSPLGSIKDVQDVIRRELIISVQSQPILMASNEAISETHAVEQLKAYGRPVRRGQKVLNPLITGFFNLILTLNNYPPLAEFHLSYVNTADYKDQADTYARFREGLLTGSQDLIMLVQALDAMKLSGYISDEEAQTMFEQEQELRRQLNILPQDL